jgi:hypothetical protein
MPGHGNEAETNNLAHSFSGLSPPAMHIGEGMEVKDPEGAEEPENQYDNDDTIQNRLDVRLHGDESVHKP